MKTAIIPAARVQQWRKKLIPQFILSSLWGQFSNQYTGAMTVPGAGNRPIPNAVVMKVSDEFSNGSYKVTIPAARITSVTVVEGPNPAVGRENKPSMNVTSAFWNVKRIAYALGDESVEGDIAKFFKLADQTSGLITTDFVKLDDYAHQRATIEGGETSLMDTGAWQNSEKGTSINAPLAQTLHPNFYVWDGGLMKKNTWSHTYATAVSNLETLLDDMDVNDVFTMLLLDKIHFVASRTVSPLGGFQGDKEIRYVLKISDVQWNQLMRDTSTGGFLARAVFTETGFKKVWSGDVGVYRGILIVVDQRSPLGEIGASGVTWQYLTPAGEGRAPVGTNVSPNTGTVELAVLYGNGALVQGIKKELDFVQQKSMDFGFESSLCGVLKTGVSRCDIDTSDTATASRVNESSFIVATATATAII